MSPAPSLVWSRQILADRSFGVAVVSSARPSCSRRLPLLQDPVNRGERGLKEALMAGRDRQDAMRQVDILLTPGHRHNLINLLGQHPMQRLLGTRSQIGQAQSLAHQMLPAHNATMLDRQDHATASHRNTLLQGGLDHREDLQFGLLRNPLLDYRSHEPPFVFFRRIASSTDWSAMALSLSWSSRLMAS